MTAKSRANLGKIKLQPIWLNAILYDFNLHLIEQLQWAETHF